MYDLVFICDANNSIGFGHVNRCINLAKHLFKNNNNSKKRLSKLIKKTLDDADNLSIQAKKLMDGNGIK